MKEVIKGSLETKDNEKIVYTHRKSSHEEVIIIAPGFLTSKDATLMHNLAKYLEDYFDVISFDFRGHGESSGVFTWTSKEELDLDIIINYASEKYKKIGIMGFSLGAATTLIWTSKNTSLVDSIIAVSPPSDFWKIDYHFWEKGMLKDVLDNLSPWAKGKGVRPGNVFLPKQRPLDCVSLINNVPVLFVHGMNDWLIKHWHSQILFDQVPHSEKRYELMPEAGHAEKIIEHNPDIFYRLVVDWFNETMCHVKAGFDINKAKRKKLLRAVKFMVKETMFFLSFFFGTIGVLALSVFPVIWYLWKFWGSVSFISLPWKIFVFCLGAIFGYCIYGISLFLIINLLRIITRFKLKEGTYSWYSFDAWKWRFFHVLAVCLSRSFLDLFPFTQFRAFFYRCLGAKIGKNALIYTRNIFDPWLIEIGDRAIIQEHVELSSYVLDRESLHLQKIKIGKGVYIGHYVKIMPGVVIEDYSVIEPGKLLTGKNNETKL